MNETVPAVQFNKFTNILASHQKKKENESNVHLYMYIRQVLLNPHHFLTSCIVLNLQYDAVSASNQKKATTHESLKLNNGFNDSEKRFRNDA